MSRKEHLTLDEFATAPGKQRMTETAAESGSENFAPSADRLGAGIDTRQEAKKALRRVKRERVRGEHFFVNVRLDRKTKRRLKLASFNAETSMQTMIEEAILNYLDEIDA